MNYYKKNKRLPKRYSRKVLQGDRRMWPICAGTVNTTHFLHLACVTVVYALSHCYRRKRAIFQEAFNPYSDKTCKLKYFILFTFQNFLLQSKTAWSTNTNQSLVTIPGQYIHQYTLHVCISIKLISQDHIREFINIHKLWCEEQTTDLSSR